MQPSPYCGAFRSSSRPGPNGANNGTRWSPPWAIAPSRLFYFALSRFRDSVLPRCSRLSRPNLLTRASWRNDPPRDGNATSTVWRIAPVAGNHEAT